MTVFSQFPLSSLWTFSLLFVSVVDIVSFTWDSHLRHLVPYMQTQSTQRPNLTARRSLQIRDRLGGELENSSAHDAIIILYNKTEQLSKVVAKYGLTSLFYLVYLWEIHRDTFCLHPCMCAMEEGDLLH